VRNTIAVDRLIRLASNQATGVTKDEFVKVVQHYHADLMRLAFSMSGDRDLAEDAVQACWQAAWRSKLDLRDPERIRAWLFTVTANDVRRQLRRQRLANLLQGKLRLPKPLGTDDRNLDLERSVQRLPLRDRQLLGLRYGAGLTSEEIGQQLGLSASGTRRRLQRVLERLRREMEDE
jgi:RNA polymerase sigma-70 factor (ECF subfamily)